MEEATDTQVDEVKEIGIGETPEAETGVISSPSTEALEAENKQLKSDVERWKKEASGQSRAVSRISYELGEVKQQLGEMMAHQEATRVTSLYDEAEELPPTKQQLYDRALAEARKRYSPDKAPPPDKMQADPKYLQALGRYQEMMERAGFTADSVPVELAAVMTEAAAKIQDGDYNGGLAVIREGIKSYQMEKAKAKAQAQKSLEEGLRTSGGASQGVSGRKPTFTREQIKDRAFWEKNKEAIIAAQADGRIT